MELRTLGSDKPIVLYMINSDKTTTGLLKTCTNFQTMQEAFRNCESQKPCIPLVLQVLPLNFISRPDTLAILDPDASTRLAREVFDRCPESLPQYNVSPTVYPPCIKLDNSVPKRVTLRLTEKPISALDNEDRVIHIAYSISPRGDWIVASWINKTGEVQACLPYSCQDRTFAQIAQEIWESTTSARPPANDAFAVYIAKVGVMNAEEKKVWVQLSNQLQEENQETVCILSVNPEPALQLSMEPPTVEAELTGSPTPYATEYQQSTSGFYNTPMSASTPQSVGLSPAATPPAIPRAFSSSTNPDKVVSTPSTLGFDVQHQFNSYSVDTADPSAQFIDITEETWGVVLGHRLNVSTSSLRLHRALVSGYLMKRSGVGDLDPPLLCEINVMHLHGYQQMQPGSAGSAHEDEQGRSEVVLREVLVMYKGLNILAMARCITDGKNSVLPWHVATARRAAIGLGLCLPMKVGPGMGLCA